jgi:FMN phosphatase YigB (HAD superfamily)
MIYNCTWSTPSQIVPSRWGLPYLLLTNSEEFKRQYGEYYRHKRAAYDEVFKSIADIPAKELADACKDIHKVLAEYIKESEEDSFVFILTNQQLPSFNKWLEKYELKDLIVADPAAVTNSVHISNGPNLNLRVLVSAKHLWRDMYEEH